MPSSIILLLALAALCILFAVIGLTALHRQRLSGGSSGRVLAWTIAALSFLACVVFGFALYVRITAEMILRG